MSTISITSNPWRLPAGNVYIEGAPTVEEAERERDQVRAARAVWKPSAEAWALFERLRREAIGRDVVVYVWDPIMYWIAEEGPYPMRALCVDVVTRVDDGLERAYVVLEDVDVMKTPEGYDGRETYLRKDDAGLLISVSDICELEARGRRAACRTS